MARSPASLTLAACILLAFLIVPMEQFAMGVDTPYRIHVFWLAHAGWTHLLFNVGVLVTGGVDLERRVGTPKFLLIATAGALGGGLLGWLFLGPEQALVGASGINYAILGAFLVAPPKELAHTMVGLILLYGWRAKAALGLLFLALCVPTSWVHLGGMLSGAVLAKAMNHLRPRPPTAAARLPERVRLPVPPAGPLPRRAGTTH